MTRLTSEVFQAARRKPAMKFSATRLCSTLLYDPPGSSERNADTQNANALERRVNRSALHSVEVASVAYVLVGG